jgi:hypothetical protein
MKSSKWLLWLIPLCCFLTVMQCSQPVAGGSSDTEVSAKIVGVATDINGNSVQDATVRLRPHDFLPDNDLPKLHLTEANCTTDENGNYLIDSVEPGEYLIEVSSGDSTGCIEACSIGKAKYTVETVLMPFATVAGNVELSYGTPQFYQNAHVDVYGTTHRTTLDSTGFFILQLPAGVHSLRFCVYESFYDTVKMNVTVQSSQYKNIGVVTLYYSLPPPFYCLNDSCDSSAVRSLLDSNGYADIPVEEVSVKGHGRIEELNLRGFDITSSLYALGRLNGLKVLDLGNTGIADSCHFLCGISQLRVLKIDSNNIAGLSRCTEGLLSLEVLDVASNLLEDLPKHLPFFSLRLLDISDNRICNLSPFMEGPIDMLCPGWEESQTCVEENAENGF